jgi:adenylylsulfate kinase
MEDMGASNMQAGNIVWHDSKVGYKDRCRLLNQKGMVVWFTGLSGAGKSTIAVELQKELFSRGKLAYCLDGDNIRHGLNADLGFSTADREENIRRIAEVAALFKDAGIITLVSFISPSQAMRNFARSRIADGMFLEVYIKANLETCMDRDPKGLYRKAVAGDIKDFTGISSPYEEPKQPDLIIDTGKLSIQQSVTKVLQVILNKC